MKRKQKIQLISALCFCILLIVYFIEYDKRASENFTSVLTESETTIEEETNMGAEMAETNSAEATTVENAGTEAETENSMEEITETEEVSEVEISSEEGMGMERKNLVIYQNGFTYEELPEHVIKRIYGLSYKEACTVPYEELRYVNVLYYNFEDEVRTGEIICNKAIAQDLVEIFYELYEAAYPIEQIRLIDEYNADDDLSCLDNNTSCFNYRVVAGSTRLSKHALGLAIDINPFYNPYVTYPNGVERISPAGSEYYANRENDFTYKIDKEDLCYQLFIKHGFTWGGNWKTLKDYQHFQKEISESK